MKKTISLFIITLLMLSVFSGCGSGVTISENRLPQELSGDVGAWVSSESAVDIEITNFVSGDWVLAGVDNTWTASACSGTMKVNGDKIEKLPLELHLTAPEAVNFGTGSAYFQYDAPEGSYMPAMPSVIYSVGEDTLALGLLDTSVTYTDGQMADYDGNTVTSVSVTEIDYDLEWNGCCLTLTCDGESATYIPQYYDGSFYNKGFNELSLVDGYTAVDDILAMDIVSDGTGTVILSDNSEYEAEYSITESGEFTVSFNGEAYTFQYMGNMGIVETGIMLRSETGTAYYSSDVVRSAELSYDSVDDVVEEVEDIFSGIYTGDDMGDSEALSNLQEAVKLRPSDSLYSDDTGLNIMGCSLARVEETLGFAVSGDIPDSLSGGQLSDEITLIYGDGKSLVVKLINPYENPIETAAALVCYIATGDDWGILGGYVCGVATQDAILEAYTEPYASADEEFVFKTAYVPPIQVEVTDNGEIILPSDYQVDMYLEFQNGILSQIRMEEPSRLYSGLQDNVKEKDYGNLTQQLIHTITTERDDILAALKYAFKEAGLSVNINVNTGEVTMDNSVLFGYDSYELSDEGRAYLDTFTQVYAEVLLSGEYADDILEIAVQGHTDSSGSYDYNLQLSQSRADEVVAYCTGIVNLENEIRDSLIDKMTATGYSYTDPVFDENGQEDADASRRVAIKFFIELP